MVTFPHCPQHSPRPLLVVELPSSFLSLLTRLQTRVPPRPPCCPRIKSRLLGMAFETLRNGLSQPLQPPVACFHGKPSVPPGCAHTPPSPRHRARCLTSSSLCAHSFPARKSLLPRIHPEKKHFSFQILLKQNHEGSSADTTPTPCCVYPNPPLSSCELLEGRDLHFSFLHV